MGPYQPLFFRGGGDYSWWWPVHAQSTQLCPTLLTPWTVAHPAPLSMGFPRQESGLPLLSPGDLPGLGIELESAALQADTSPLSHQGSPQLRWEKHYIFIKDILRKKETYSPNF